MGCVNKTSKEFKDLAAKHNVSHNKLELIVHKYWLESGNETLFPSDVYIQAQLGNKAYEEHGKSVRKLWELRYNTPMEFSNMKEVQKAVMEASKYFPQSAIHYYRNANDHFTFTVEKPVEKADNKDDFFDSYDGNGSLKNVKTLKLGIEENKTYGIDKIQELYNRFNTDKTSKALADRAFNIAKELELQIVFDESLPFGTMGRYHNDNTIRFKKSFLERDMMNSKKAPIMLHEVLHALSMYTLSNQTKNWKRSENLEGFRTEIKSLYQELKDNPILKGERGIVDLYEFVAELANPVFRDKIKNIDRDVTAEKKIEKKSFWSRIVDAFKKLLGLHVTNTYYQRSTNALEKALDAFDIDTYMRYNGIKKPLRDGYNAKEWEFNSMSDAEVKSNVKDYLDKQVAKERGVRLTDIKPEYKGKLIYAQSGTGKSTIADNITVFDSDYLLGQVLGVSPETAGFFFGRLSASQKKAFGKQYRDAIKQKIAEGYTVVTANESLLPEADVVVYNSSAKQTDERVNREDRAINNRYHAIDYHKSTLSKIKELRNNDKENKKEYRELDNGHYLSDIISSDLSIFRNTSSDLYGNSKQKESNSRLREEVIADFLNEFGITVHTISNYNGELPLFDALNRVINAKEPSDITDGVGYAIAFMMQGDPEMQRMVVESHFGMKGDFDKRVPIINKKLKNLHPNQHSPIAKEVLKEVGTQIATELRNNFDSDIEDVKSDKSIWKVIKNFFKKLGMSIAAFGHRGSVQKSENLFVKDIIAALGREDYSRIRGPRIKEGTNELAQRVDVETALKENPYEDNIIRKLGEHGIALAGSTSIALQGSLFRPSENPLHDIDFNAGNNSSKESLDKLLPQIFPEGTIQFSHALKKDKNGDQTVTYITLSEPFEIRKTGFDTADLYSKDGRLLGKRKHYDLELADGVQGKMLDFFTGPTQESNHGFYNQTINGHNYLLSESNAAMAAKILWARPKDMWDYKYFKKNDFINSLSGKELKEELSLIKQESADYGIVNGIEEEHKHSGKAVPQDFTFADGTKVKAPFKPNAQQVDALNEMNRFMKSDETSMTLSGYAGTGKTSLMEIIAKKGQKQYRPVQFCASTNKAAAVLNDRVSKAGFKATTLNKLFGINVEVDENSSHYNARNLVTALRDVDIAPGTTVVIDEASMINEENYNILNSIAKRLGLKIIYVGDEAQLAPVNETQISKVFRNGDGKIIRLTQVERTADNAILKEATDLRNGKVLSGESSFNSKGEGVAYISPSHQDAIDEVIEGYSKELKKDPNHFRILAYTNKAVAAYNNQVRGLLGYKTPIPQVGEPMMGYAQWGYDWRSKSYRLINSESYKVTRVDKPRTVSINTQDGKTLTMVANPITMVDSTGKEDTFNYIDVKSNPQNREVAKVLADEKQILWGLWKRAVGRDAKAKVLQRINAIDEFLFINDNLEGEPNSKGIRPLLAKKVIDFGYAMTVHKSQGSTFTNVLLDDVDIARGTRGNSTGNFESFDMVNLGEDMGADLTGTTFNDSSSEEVDFGDLNNVETSALGEESIANPTTPQTVNIRQQLEYVGVSRATDTVTVISNGIKKEGSPLHPEKAIKEDKITSKQQAQPTLAEQKLKQFRENGIFYSGGANGSDLAWARELESLGLKVKHYLVNDYDSLSQEEKDGIERVYKDVVKTLGRRELPANNYAGKLVRRDYLQVAGAGAIYAIGTFDKSGNVSGGTAYAVEYARKIGGKPIYFYSLDTHQWYYAIDSNAFAPMNSLPHLTERAAVIGTRDDKTKTGADALRPEGIQAIKNVIANTFGNALSQNTIPKQLISHLKSQGINVKDRAAMEEFLKTHKLEYLQQAIAYDKEHPYENANHVGKIPEILSIVKAKKYNKPGTDAVTLESENHSTIYLIDHSADKELADNLKDGDGFGIRKVYNVNTITKDDVREIIRNIASDYRESEISIRHRLQNLGLGPKDLSGINIAAELKMVPSSNGDMVLSRRGEWTSVNNNRRSSNGRESKEGSRLEDRARHDGIDLYTTSQGEVYGFVDKEGNIYLDETKISPEHPIHEYTHLWDRTVQQKNPKLWQRGVELMKQTPLWYEILNDANYGKTWQSMNLSQEKLDNLIASEVHARFTGEGGEKLLNQIAEKQGQSGIIAKLKQWILNVWKDLKATFGNWSQEDLDKLTLKDFNHMTVRDFTEGINLKDASNVTYTSQQKQQADWARTSSNGYEVSTRGDRRFSALIATFKPGTIIDGVDVGGKTIEHVYQNVIKKSGKGKAPAKNSKLYNESLKTNEEREDFSYQEGYLPLWKEWAKQNPELMTELREKSQGKVLTDQFANTRVSQARALAEILNESEVKDNTQNNTKVENLSEKKEETQQVSLPGYEYYKELYDETPVDAEWKVSYLKELDAQLSLENSEEENQNIINQMDNVLQATSEKEYLQDSKEDKKKQAVQRALSEHDKIVQQLNDLLDNKDLQELGCSLSAQEIRHVAEQIANELSDLITQLQEEKGLAQAQYGREFELDFQIASRKDIVKAIGITNMIRRAKQIFSPEVTDYDDIDTIAQAHVIGKNWDAMMYLASDIFAMNEGFGITKDYTKHDSYVTTEGAKIDHDNFNDYSNDPDAAAETGEKDEQEHWQVEQRTIDVLNSMSALVRQGLHECFVLDKDGNKVYSKWQIAERVNPRATVNSILRWTQGSTSLEDMVTKLSQKQSSNPWLSQLISRLSDKSGKETDFQSQFYGVFSKHYQLYSIVLMEDGKYESIPVNSHPALSEAIKGITAQFRIGEHPLFTEKSINNKYLGSKETTSDKSEFNLFKALKELTEVDATVQTTKTLDEEMTEKVISNIIGVSKMLGYPATEEMLADVVNVGNVHAWVDNLRHITDDLSKASKALQEGKIKSYDPFKYYGDYNISNALRNFLAPVMEKMEDTAVNAFYDSGKMYQSYITPSFMTKLMNKFKYLDGAEFEKFIMGEYGSSEWFKYQDHGNPMSRGWRNRWLHLLANDPEARKAFDHKVELNFNKHNYMRNMSDQEYALSLIMEFFAEDASYNGKGKTMPTSWYRVPMMSNKPSSEFIKFYSYRGDSYKKNVARDMFDIFLQELSRIQTVRMRNLSKNSPEFIKNFDSNGKRFNFLPVFNSYLENTDSAKAKRTLLHNEDGTVSTDNNKFAELLQRKLEGTELTKDEKAIFNNLADAIIRQSLEDRVQSILDKWEKGGILEAAEKISGIYPSEFNDEKQMGSKENMQNAIKEHVRKQVEMYLWNDTLASKNILLLTIGDIAFYKDAEDLQKRLSQLHAPGIRGRKEATDYEGNRVSDGKYRTVILKDFDDFKSNLIANITEVFDKRIVRAETIEQKKRLEVLRDSLVRPRTYNADGSVKDKGGKYWNINVADAQGFSSPSSYRKKALIFGKWSRHAEDIYQKLVKGEYNYTDLEVAFQPLKPFVYSKLTKNLGVENAPIHSMQVPFQAKNAEYLLFMADALLKGEELSRPNLLRAVYRVMEDSEKFCPTKGIDTIQFESAIKSGLQGKLDIAQFREEEGGEEAAYAYMMNQIFKPEADDNTGDRIYREYNTDVFVHETSYDDYCLQQEVPEHFKNHSQAHGSQTRMIIPSDLDLFTTDENGNQVDNFYEWDEPDGTHKKVSATEYKKEYENTIKENIEESIDVLTAELHLNSDDKKERNLALSRILQNEIISSPRYGIDLVQACSIDKETGEFRIPKGDPIQAKRIEQLINSIIKNRINKQKIAGGPIVQVSNFGTSQQLHIRFKDKSQKNGIIPLEKDYVPSEHNGLSYKEYIKKNQGGIAYFEVYAPIWSNDIFDKFANEDGSINVEAINAVNPELLKMVSYRIPTEDKYSCAPMKVVGFMPREAGDAIMLPYELTEIDDSDFDVDKRYVMRKDISIVEKNYDDYVDELEERGRKLYKEIFGNESSQGYVERMVSNLAKNPKAFHRDSPFRKALFNEYQKLAFKTVAPTSGRTYRDNKIIDMTYAVLTNEMTADKILNPGGFDAPKKMGYMVAAYKNTNNKLSWQELQDKSIDELKDLSYTDKDLTFTDTQVQFYKQNAAAASLIGVFAVNKVAHATLEGDSIYLDVAQFCGKKPFIIAGTTFDGRMQIDGMYDQEGNLIGKTLGSLVSASADAVKDPILNLMNINMTTAGMLNTMLRLGMPFNDAALFLSQDIIERTLNEFNRKNLSNYEPLDNIINKWLEKYREKYDIDENSNINNEALTRDELVEGLKSDKHEAIDYKVLLAFQKMRSLTDAMRKPTFATRFNSISSAVGPLIVDNLILEHKMESFLAGEESSTGFYTSADITDDAQVDITSIFESHPILQQFARTVGIARGMFYDMPAGSKGFRKLLGNLPSDISDKMFRDKKLLDSFSTFYQSYLLIKSGVINPANLGNYVNGFPEWFMKQDFKKKYPDNALIQAIKMNVSKKTGKPFLSINITGMDEQQKEELRSAWTDLHRADADLSKKLFDYCFFRAGIGFSPKTFMALVPTYVKEHLVSKDGQSSYVDTYRKFPNTEYLKKTIIDQFIRNNWDNNKLVPIRGEEGTNYNVNLAKGTLKVYRDADKVDVQDLSYMKTKVGKDWYLWKRKEGKSEDIEFERVKPLGNNGEYLEISLADIEKPLEETTKKETPVQQPNVKDDATVEDTNTSDLKVDSPMESDAQESSKPQVSDAEKVENTDEIIDLLTKQNPKFDKESAEKKFEEIKKSPKVFAGFLQNVFKHKGLDLDRTQAVDEFKKYC